MLGQTRGLIQDYRLSETTSKSKAHVVTRDKFLNTQRNSIPYTVYPTSDRIASTLEIEGVSQEIGELEEVSPSIVPAATEQGRAQGEHGLRS